MSDRGTPTWLMLWCIQSSPLSLFYNSVLQGVLVGSKYLKATQELLDEVVSVVARFVKGEKMKGRGEAAAEGGGDPVQPPNNCDGEAGAGKGPGELSTSTAERQELRTKKAKLVNMLDELKETHEQFSQKQGGFKGDVVVRIRTEEGRDERFYSHSHVLKKCKYFADRLSYEWPTCQILESRNCVEIYCEEIDFNHHVNVLNLLNVPDDLLPDNHLGVRNALGMLRVSIHLGCPLIMQACINYLEAVPWEEAEEEEILRIIPTLGSVAERILARLCPVDSVAIVGVFLAALHLATSSSPSMVKELKISAQEQLEYILTEDDDAPLVTLDDGIRFEVIACVMPVLERFVESLNCVLKRSPDINHGCGELQVMNSFLSDLSWACQILLKLEMMKEFVHSWVDSSETIVTGIECLNATGDGMLEVKLKVTEVAAKVLEAVGYGNVILPTERRLHLAKTWLPFFRKTKPLFDAVNPEDDDWVSTRVDGELWQIVESAIVSIVLALPSTDQAEILAEWLNCEHTRYPDLTEAFEMWCYRSKVARRRMAVLGSQNRLSSA